MLIYQKIQSHGSNLRSMFVSILVRDTTSNHVSIVDSVHLEDVVLVQPAVEHFVEGIQEQNHLKYDLNEIFTKPSPHLSRRTLLDHLDEVHQVTEVDGDRIILVCVHCLPLLIFLTSKYSIL